MNNKLWNIIKCIDNILITPSKDKDWINNIPVNHQFTLSLSDGTVIHRHSDNNDLAIAWQKHQGASLYHRQSTLLEQKCWEGLIPIYNLRI